MTLLPVVARELRVASRRRSTYTSRVAAVGIATVLGTWMMVMLSRFLTTSVVGTQLFKALSWFALVYALIAGTKATADTISSEKRQGTLGLLFLTDLKGYDVLLGKLVAASVDTFYALMAMLPLLAIPLLMGGVTAAEVWRVGLAVFGALLFALSAGMLASSLSFVERKATGSAYLIVSVACAGIPLIAEIMKIDRPQLSLVVFLLSPSYSCWTAFANKFATDPAQYYISLSFTFLASTVFLVLASHVAARSWREGRRHVENVHKDDQLHPKAWNRPESKREFRRRLLDINPIYWLASRYRHMQTYPWIFLVSMAIVSCWGFAIDPAFVRIEGATVAFYLINFIFKYWFATIACYGFNTDRDQGALELIFSTPLRVNEILKGQWLALARMFLWPFATLLAIEILLTFVNATLRLSMINSADHDALMGWTLFAILSAILLIIDSVALGWVGLWQSLHSKTPHRAASAAMAGVLTLPTVAFLVLFGLCIFVAPHCPAGLLIALWFFLSLIADFFFIIIVCRRFTLNLRAVISEKTTAHQLREPS